MQFGLTFVMMLCLPLRQLISISSWRPAPAAKRSPARRQQSRPKNFFHRELFRIVFR